MKYILIGVFLLTVGSAWSQTCSATLSVGGSRCFSQTTVLTVSTPLQGPNFTYKVTIWYGNGLSSTRTGSEPTVSFKHVYSNPTGDEDEVVDYSIEANVEVFDNETSICVISTSADLQITQCNSGVTCSNLDFESDYDYWFFSSDNDQDRILIPYDPYAVDPYAGFRINTTNRGQVLKLGNDLDDNLYYNAELYYNQGLNLTPENAKFAIRFAMVAGGELPEDDTNQPTFELIITSSESPISTCGNGGNIRISNSFTPGFTKVPGQDVYYLPWTTLHFDLSEYVGQRIYVRLNVTKRPGKFAYIYADGFCEDRPLATQSEVCTHTPMDFSPGFETGFGSLDGFQWDMGDGTIYTQKDVTHTYSLPGVYTVTFSYNPPFLPLNPIDTEDLSVETVTTWYDNPIRVVDPDKLEAIKEWLERRDEWTNQGTELFPPISTRCGGITITQQVTVSDCNSPDSPPFVCEDCIPPFSPIPGELYVVSAWAKQGNGTGLSTYEAPSLIVYFMNGDFYTFKPSGVIVDGWQRIEGVFTVPLEAEYISVTLRNDGKNAEVFFDDVRVQPFNSSMKTFVFDPVTLRMMAELDERNYASFFEYDEEGKLVRVKKETERGIRTLSETNMAVRKRNR